MSFRYAKIYQVLFLLCEKNCVSPCCSKETNTITSHVISPLRPTPPPPPNSPYSRPTSKLATDEMSTFCFPPLVVALLHSRQCSLPWLCSGRSNVCEGLCLDCYCTPGSCYDFTPLQISLVHFCQFISACHGDALSTTLVVFATTSVRLLSMFHCWQRALYRLLVLRSRRSFVLWSA